MAGIRSFVAIPLDVQLRQKLGGLIEIFRTSWPENTIRWVDPHNIHLTVKFLGDVPSHQIAGIERALCEVAAGSTPFAFRLAHLGCFPNPRRPRVVWTGVEEPTGELKALAGSVEGALAPLGFTKEERGFSPHVTLGRVRREVGAATLREVGAMIQASDVGSIGRQHVNDIHLFRSDLKPSGPIYTTLARIPLGKAP